MDPELLYQLALALVPNIGDVHARILLEQFGSASGIFKAPLAFLERTEGIGTVRAQSIKRFHDFAAAEAEMAFTEKYGIRTLFLSDLAYPQKLRHCSDAPVLLFYKGTADLNTARTISIVGTRGCTEYGKQATERLIADLSAESVTIVSGLALGVDTCAHKAALRNGLPTLGVVGHGLDKIYPYTNTALARDMIARGGGLLTEFFSDMGPDKHHFPLRNRIVAGISDATVVVETGVKGGSMITARLADSYNRDVFAVPGRTTDPKSAGCNYLIQHQKAHLLHSAEDLLQVMGWKEKNIRVKQQRELFVDLSPEERTLAGLLGEKEQVMVDELCSRSGLTSSAVSAALLNLELQGLIASLPGKTYRLL